MTPVSPSEVEGALAARGRNGVFLAILTLIACGPMEKEVVDAGLIEDAGFIDAGEADAGVLDAGASDAGPVDAGTSDAGAPVLCNVGQIPGTCLDVSQCTGTRSSTAGLCPGPSSVQCCTPRYAKVRFCLDDASICDLGIRSGGSDWRFGSYCRGKNAQAKGAR